MSAVNRSTFGRSCCRLQKPAVSARIQPVRAVKVEQEVEQKAKGAQQASSAHLLPARQVTDLGMLAVANAAEEVFTDGPDVAPSTIEVPSVFLVLMAA